MIFQQEKRSMLRNGPRRLHPYWKGLDPESNQDLHYYQYYSYVAAEVGLRYNVYSDMTLKAAKSKDGTFNNIPMGHIDSLAYPIRAAASRVLNSLGDFYSEAAGCSIVKAALRLAVADYKFLQIHRELEMSAERRTVNMLVEGFNACHGIGECIYGKFFVTYYKHLNHVLQGDAGDLADGCIIVDFSHLQGTGKEGDVIRESVGGPMAAMVEVDEGEGPLHYVTPRTKANRWKAVGAKVGVWDGNTCQVVWEA